MKRAGKWIFSIIISVLLLLSFIGVSHANTAGGDPVGDTVEYSYHGQLGRSEAYGGWGNGLGMLEKWCALPNFNLKEEGQDAWEAKCGKCHIGANWSTSRNTTDCTLCHQSPAGGKGPGEAPTKDKCMTCHWKDTSKRGDVFKAASNTSNASDDDICLAIASRGDVFSASNDVHIAAGMNCQFCHRRLEDEKSDHQIAKGRVIDTTEDTMEGTMLLCVDCHGSKPHTDRVGQGDELDEHLDKVACEVCHTGLRPGNALESRRWNEFTETGKPVTVKRWTDWLPEHKWYQSEGVTGHLPILGYTELKDYPGAKIYPFNPVTVTWFIKTSTSPLDDNIVVADVKAADANGDRITNVTEMRTYDGDNDGNPDYPDATLVTEDMNFQISHSVTAKDAFTCGDCHCNSGWVLNWTQLGYDGDPYNEKVYFVPHDCIVEGGSNNSADVEIWVSATEFKSGQINLSYDSSCANITNYVWNRTNFPMSGWTHHDGREWITFMTLEPSLSGNYQIGTLTIDCECDECTTPLDFIEGSKLSNSTGSEIPVAWNDGTFECKPGICGDLNHDGTVGMDDVGELVYRVGTHGTYEWRADVNCNGEIDIGDVILLMNRVADPAEYELRCCANV